MLKGLPETGTLDLWCLHDLRTSTWYMCTIYGAFTFPLVTNKGLTAGSFGYNCGDLHNSGDNPYVASLFPKQVSVVSRLTPETRSPPVLP